MDDEKTYRDMPKERHHECHVVNPAKIPTDWIEYDEERYGWSLESTNAYGDDSTTEITYCPWCGVKLHLEEHEKKLSRMGKMNRDGIITPYTTK